MYHLDKIRELNHVLSSESSLAEEDGQLTDKQLNLLYEHKLFKLFVPEIYGGLSLTLMEGLLIEEELASIDGSLGWTVTLCAGANLFVGYLDKKIADSLFRDEKVCLGGSGKPAGKAELSKTGYCVSGEWDYATGAPHNTAFTANCVLEQSGAPILDAQGNPLIKSFVFLRNEVDIIGNSWNTMGLKATASATFSVNKLFVNKDRAFEIEPDHTVLNDVIYRFPFQQLAASTLAVNTLCMGKHFLACCSELFQHKYVKSTQLVPWGIYDGAVAQIHELRSHLFLLIEQAWREMLRNGELVPETANKVSAISRQLVLAVQQQITLLYPYCGMKGARLNSEINRIWRDLFTASQHNLLIQQGV